MSRHQPRERFGQNFLTDLSVVDHLVQAIDPQPGQALIEVGPGLGALTDPLLARVDYLTVVEIDRDLAARLVQRYPADRLTLIQADALSLDWQTLGQDLRLVGNLPYNISTPLLFTFLGIADRVRDQHFMLQREVVDRMVARPGDSENSRLSIMLQCRYRMHKLFDVPPQAFDPPPRVVSAVVRMIPLGSDRLQARDMALFAAVVQRAFAQRRKMLRGALGDWAKQVPWQTVAVDPTARAEDLGVADFVRISDALSERSLPARSA